MLLLVLPLADMGLGLLEVTSLSETVLALAL